MAPPAATTSRRTKGGTSDDTNSSHKRKRKATDEDFETSQAPATKRFQHLKPRTKCVSQNLITAKWTPLPTTAQHQIRELYRSAKRPVFLSRRDERHRREAEVVLDHMVRRLEKQLPRMPFPPKSKDIHFDLDKLVERNRLLESQVTPAMHSIELLKAEIEKEEASLQRDRQALQRLEKNARAEQRESEKQAKKLHPLLEDGTAEDATDTAEWINLRDTSRRHSAWEDEVDTELQTLLDQFSSHLQSMRTNTDQLHGLDRALGSAGAALSARVHST